MIYYLSLGANLGEREQTLNQALQAIEQQIGPVLRRSSFFYSEPWGFQSEHPFCNLCCAIETPLAPLDALSLTQSIERALGRKEKSQMANGKSQMANYTDRCIDIDLIRVFGDDGQEVFIDTPKLSIPHKLWAQRDFVKVPLAEIMQ